MNNTYEWLYDSYALPLMQKITASQDEAVEELVKTLSISEENRISFYDAITNMRLNWGGEVFALGLQFGLRLVHPSDT